jgi:N-acetylneuraminic acid mutarotase
MVQGKTGLSTVALSFYLLVLPFAALAQTWSPAAPMPTARAALGAAAVDGTIFAIGGIEAGGPIPSAKNQALDTTSGLWSAKASLPEARIGLTVVAAGGKVYAFGGHNGSSLLDSVEAYDPVTNTWSSPTNWAVPRVGHSAVELGGKIYLIGGIDASGGFASTVDVYDPASNSWGTAAATPNGRALGGAAAAGGLIYYAAGVGSDGATPLIVYDPGTNAWTSRGATLPPGLSSLAVVSFDGTLYALGGTQTGLDSLNTVYKYDAAADAWLAAPAMPTGRRDLAAAALGSSLYAMGGWPSAGDALASVDVLTVAAVDAIAPQTVAARFPAPNAAGWNNGNVTLTLTATDNEGGSGVKSITYKVTEPGGGFSGATVNDSTAVVVASAEGTSIVTYFAIDNAGNVEAQKSLTVMIDKTPPIAVMALSAVLWPPNNRLVPVAPAISVADPGGGPVTISGPVVTSNEPLAAGDVQVSGGTLQLRATRSGKNTAGRVYTVTYTVTDQAGNSTSASGTVTVPHDQGKK